MRLSKKKISFYFYILILSIIGCNDKTESILNTEIRFLYEDCSNNPIKHSSSIPSNVTSILVRLKKDGSTILEKKIQNEGTNSAVIIDNIEPYDKYRLDVIAFTNDNKIWSGFAENIPINQKKKTFVQINLTQEKGLTCADYLNTKRFMHSSINLGDGRILIFGGATSIEIDYGVYHINTTENAEIFYPYKIESTEQINTNIIAGTSNKISSHMISGRVGFIYEQLKDGKILIAGGINKADIYKNPDDFFLCLNENSAFIYDVEIFDPETEKFQVITRINTPFAFAQSAIIGNKIYILGGINNNFNCNNLSSDGINKSLIIMDVTNIISPKIDIETSDDFAFFAAGKIKLSEEKYLFYGGNREDGLILYPDGKTKKVNFNISEEFNGKVPQKGYLPYAFTIQNGKLYINTSGYYKFINDRYFIEYISDDKISIKPDNNSKNELVFGGSFISYGDYLFQIGGIKSIPFTISNLFLARKIKQDGYEDIDNKLIGVEKLKRERAFHSTVLINENNFLITGGLYFNQAQEGIVLDLVEIYNGADSISK